MTNIDRRFSSKHLAARHDVSTCQTGVNSIDDIHMESPIVNSPSRLFDESFSDSDVPDIVVIPGPPFPAKHSVSEMQSRESLSGFFGNEK